MKDAYDLIIACIIEIVLCYTYRRATVSGRYRRGFFTPPFTGAVLQAAAYHNKNQQFDCSQTKLQCARLLTIPMEKDTDYV
jgi:hypothetical protein